MLLWRKDFVEGWIKLAITVKDIVELAQKKGCVLATGESKLSKEVYYVDTMSYILQQDTLIVGQKRRFCRW